MSISLCDANTRIGDVMKSSFRIFLKAEFIVYSAIEANPGSQAKPYLYLREMGQSQAKPITGTEGGISPFLSPDDRYVGFWADGKLKKVPVEGGVATSLCNVDSIFGASWGQDDSIVFADGISAGLSRVSADGGNPESLTKPDPRREEASHRLPRWLPGGKAVVFTILKHSWDIHPALGLLSLDNREWRVLLPDAADTMYVPTGHLVFLRQGTLMAVRFDLDRLQVFGQPVALVEGVIQAFAGSAWQHTEAGQFCISDTGSLIYAAGEIPPAQKNSLVWVDRKGIEQPVTALQFPFDSPRLSPDGQKIAYATSELEGQIWVYNLTKGTNSRLFDEGSAGDPVWTPDGKRLLFSWHKSLAFNLFWQPYDGSSPMERLTTSDYHQFPGSWSDDRKTLVFVDCREDDFGISVLDIDSRRVTRFLQTTFVPMYSEFSPDGRWIAYDSTESTGRQVYVRPFPGPGVRYQVSNEGGSQPLWAKDGKQLFYRSGDQVWAVDVKTDGGAFASGKPRLLFKRAGYSMGGPLRGYDLSLDGQRFLMVKEDQRKPGPVTELVLVQNWFEELKRLIPGAKN